LRTQILGNGNIRSEEFINQHGRLHNAAGPAVRYWYEKGQLSCEDYWLNGNRHNAAGPAYRSWHSNGQLEYEAYYLSGKSHNAAGPAYRSWKRNGNLGHESYYLNGKLVTFQALLREFQIQKRNSNEKR
jgi:antitoxin component YwqK of YwqJK toxin-antitoxin module